SNRPAAIPPGDRAPTSSAARSSVRHALLRRLIDLFWCEQHDGLRANGAARVDGQSRGRDGDMIGSIDNDERVGIAEGKIERFQFSAGALQGPLRGGSSLRATVLEKPFGSI